LFTIFERLVHKCALDKDNPVSDADSVTATARQGTAMALTAIVSVQVGIAVSVPLFDELGAAGVACLRLLCAAVVLVVLLRPRLRRLGRDALLASSGLGAVTGGMTLLFMEAVARLPLGTAVALEFLGPLGVAVLRGGPAARAWAVVAAVGVAALTAPWEGSADAAGVAYALGAAACWAAYILLTQHVGRVVSGVTALAISMPVAAVVALVAARPSIPALVQPEILLAGLGLALLVPVIPFALEMLALKRLPAATFGTLMCLEPAMGALVGWLVLDQVPGLLTTAGIALVVVAAAGASSSVPVTPMHDGYDDRAHGDPEDRRRDGVGQPGADAADGAERMVDVLLEVMDPVVEERDAELVEPDQQDVAADPEHRRDPERGQHRHHDRHASHQPAAERRGRPVARPGET
jgi:inner membrane transporter RhtA